MHWNCIYSLKPRSVSLHVQCKRRVQILEHRNGRIYIYCIMRLACVLSSRLRHTARQDTWWTKSFKFLEGIFSLFLPLQPLHARHHQCNNKIHVFQWGGTPGLFECPWNYDLKSLLGSVLNKDVQSSFGHPLSAEAFSARWRRDRRRGDAFLCIRTAESGVGLVHWLYRSIDYSPHRHCCCCCCCCRRRLLVNLYRELMQWSSTAGTQHEAVMGWHAKRGRTSALMNFGLSTPKCNGTGATSTNGAEGPKKRNGFPNKWSLWPCENEP